MAVGGRFLANLALTDPAFPCVLVTFPQITRKLDFSDFPGTGVLFLACNNKLHKSNQTQINKMQPFWIIDLFHQSKQSKEAVLTFESYT